MAGNSMREPHPFQGLQEETPKPQRIGRTIKVGAPKKTALRQLGKLMPEFFQFLFFFGGLLSIAGGFYMVYHPLGPIVGGIFATVVGYYIADDKEGDSK